MRRIQEGRQRKGWRKLPEHVGDEEKHRNARVKEMMQSCLPKDSVALIELLMVRFIFFFVIAVAPG